MLKIQFQFVVCYIKVMSNHFAHIKSCKEAADDTNNCFNVRKCIILDKRLLPVVSKVKHL